MFLFPVLNLRVRSLSFARSLFAAYSGFNISTDKKIKYRKGCSIEKYSFCLVLIDGLLI